jgi:hypothetical protein
MNLKIKRDWQNKRGRINSLKSLLSSIKLEIDKLEDIGWKRIIAKFIDSTMSAVLWLRI